MNINDYKEKIHELKLMEENLFTHKIDMVLIFSEFLNNNNINLFLSTKKDIPIYLIVENNKKSLTEFIINYDSIITNTDYSDIIPYLNILLELYNQLDSISSYQYIHHKNTPDILIGNELQWLQIMTDLIDKPEYYSLYIYNKIHKSTIDNKINSKSSKI